MKISNKRAFFDFRLLEHFEAGVNLLGSEVKSIRLGHADLTGSFVKIIGSEAYLVNAKIFPYQYGNLENYDEGRTRKLLLHKSEIISIKNKLESQNLAVIPVSIYTKKGLIKVELALGKGKKKFEKKEAIKRKDIQREVEQELADNT